MKKWNIVHDCDTDEGKPTCWACEINHSEYGQFVWITEEDNGYGIAIDRDELVVLITCKSLASAKRWVSINLI